MAGVDWVVVDGAAVGGQIISIYICSERECGLEYKEAEESIRSYVIKPRSVIGKKWNSARVGIYWPGICYLTLFNYECVVLVEVFFSIYYVSFNEQPLSRIAFMELMKMQPKIC